MHPSYSLSTVVFPVYGRAVPKRRPDLPRNHVSAQQLVAHNFRRAREERGWTQAETSDQLAPYLGYALKQSGVSAIERTADDGVSRNLDIDELVAFASCFDRPMSWFLIPPAGAVDRNVQALGPSLPGSHVPHTAMHLLRAAVGTSAGWVAVRTRLRELLDEADDGERMHIEQALEATFDLEPEDDLDLQLDLRREALRDTRLASFFNPRDALVRDFAEKFVELLRFSTPEALFGLRDLDTEDALRVIAEGDDLVSGLGKKRDPNLGRHRYDDVRPMNREALLRHATAEPESDAAGEG